MPSKAELLHAGGFLLSEAEGTRSRDKITVVSGQNLKAGHVLGRKFTAATATGAAAAGNTGNGTIGSVAVGKARKNGVYRLTCIEPGANVGTFQVEDPDGNVIGTAVVAVAYTGDGPAFTIADGATDFVAGDAFLVTVTGGTVKHAVYDPAATDGTQYAVGVLLDDVDASAADKDGVAFVRDCEVNSNELTWFTGATAAQKTTGIEQLAALGIIARS